MEINNIGVLIRRERTRCRMTQEKLGERVGVGVLAKKFYWVEQDCWVSLNISAAGLRTINKLGLDAAIKMAAEKGYLNA